MAARAAPRWTLSFADLCLLLLGFFVILHARADRSQAVADGLRTAFGGRAAALSHRADFRADALFQPGEAVFLPGRADMLAALGRKAAGAHGRATVRSTGADAATQRFDGWELAAARTAAVARALRSGGLDEKRIAIDLPAMDGGAPGSGPGGGQRIGVLLRGAR